MPKRNGDAHGSPDGDFDFSDWNPGDGHGALDSVAALSESFGGCVAAPAESEVRHPGGSGEGSEGGEALEAIVMDGLSRALDVFAAAAIHAGHPSLSLSPDLLRVRDPDAADVLDCAAEIAGTVGVGTRGLRAFLAEGGVESAFGLLPGRMGEIRRLAAWTSATGGVFPADDDTLDSWAARAELLAEESEGAGHAEAAEAGRILRASLLPASGGRERSLRPELTRDDAWDGWARFAGSGRLEAAARAACAVLGAPLPPRAAGTPGTEPAAAALLEAIAASGAAETAAAVGVWSGGGDESDPDGPAAGLRTAAGVLLGSISGLQWIVGRKDEAVRGILRSAAAVLRGGAGGKASGEALSRALWILGMIPEAGAGGFDGETAVVLDRIELTDSEADGSEWVDLADLYSRLLSPVPVLPLAKAPDEIAAALAEEFPWADDAIAAVRRELSLAVRLGLKRLRLPPVLLVGPPACGKSRFARRLADLSGAPSMGVGAASGGDSFTVAGVGRAWKGRQPSLPAIAMNRFRAANPVLVVEEIDKAGESREYGSLQNALLTLLDPETSSHWPDPCLLGNLDASKCCWIATANDLAGISSPLASRFLVLRFPRPKAEHIDGVVFKMLGSIANEFGIPKEAVEAAAALDGSDLAGFRREWLQGADLRALFGAVRRRVSEGPPSEIQTAPADLGANGSVGCAGCIGAAEDSTIRKFPGRPFRPS